MDILIVIVALATGILSLYIGYVLGNFFPMIKRSKETGEVKSDDKVLDWFKSALEYLLGSDEEETVSLDELDDLEAPAAVETESPAEEVPISGDRDSFLEVLASEITEEDKAAAAQGAPAASAPARAGHPFGEMVSAEDVTGVWHNRKSQEMIVEIKGKRFSLLQELNPDQHSRLSLLLVDLQDKVGLSAELKSSLTEEFEKRVEEEEKLRQPTFNPLQAVVKYVQADVPKLEEASEGIPAQINKILQEQIQGTPLDAKGIQVSEMGDKGVVFIVGLDIYHEIHQVPESEVRTAIRKAVNTWEDENLGV